MIQKIGITLLKRNASKMRGITNISRNETKNIISKYEPANKQSILFVKNLLNKLKNKLIILFNKIFKNNELKKSNKPKVALYDNSDKIYIDKAKELLDNPKLPENIKDIIRNEIAYAEKTISVETNSYTCGALQSLKNAISKAEDALKNISFGKNIDNIEDTSIEVKSKYTDIIYGRHINDIEEHTVLSLPEKQLTKNHDIDSHSIDIDDKYADLINGNHTNNIENETSHSLLDAMQGNHSRNCQENLDDVAENGLKHIDDNIDDLTAALFD